MDEQKKNRHFILGEDVGQSQAKELIKEIREINKHDDEQEQKVKDYERDPIELVVNSYGGSVYDGAAIMAVMQQSKTPIHTYCYGMAMSMGFHIFIEGHKRFAHPFATFMHHDMGGITAGNLEAIKETSEEWTRIRTMLDGRVLERTNVLQEQLDKVLDRKQNWYISTQEAKKLGIVQEVL